MDGWVRQKNSVHESMIIEISQQPLALNMGLTETFEYVYFLTLIYSLFSYVSSS